MRQSLNYISENDTLAELLTEDDRHADTDGVTLVLEERDTDVLYDAHTEEQPVGEPLRDAEAQSDGDGVLLTHPLGDRLGDELPLTDMDALVLVLARGDSVALELTEDVAHAEVDAE